MALSDSNSHKTSSIFTESPSFLFQDETVTSVIDSPTAGTLISITCELALGVATGAGAIATGCAGASTGAGATGLVSTGGATGAGVFSTGGLLTADC